MSFTFPRRYLTFAELLARWKCGENDVREVIASGKLKPSILTSEPLAPALWMDDPILGHMVPDVNAGTAPGITAPMFLFLQWPEQTGPFECTFRLAADERDAAPPANEQELIARSEALNDKSCDSYPCWFVLPRPMMMVDVQGTAVFMQEEIVGFEMRYGASGQAAHGATRDLTPRERTTLLNIIGALLELSKSSGPGRDSDAALIAKLEANYSDVAGISKRTLEEKFAEAKKFFAASLSKT